MSGDATPMTHHDVGTRRFWESFIFSRRAATIALGWGFAEATFFFIVPDVWIGLLALFSWRAGLRAAAWAVAGALLGGALMFGVGGQLDRDAGVRLLDAVPAASPAMIERVEGEMRERGPASVMLGPLQGTPYKIYAWAAGEQRQSLVALLLWSIPARAVRFVAIAAVAALYGRLAPHKTLEVRWLLGPYLLAWVVFYGLYFRAYGL